MLCLGPKGTKEHPAPCHESGFVPDSQLTCFEKGTWWLEMSPMWAVISMLPSCLMVNVRFYTS